MIQALCRTLFHSLWQGLLLAVISGIIILCTRRTAAALRYNIIGGLLLLFLLGCAGTFAWEWGDQSGQAGRAQSIAGTEGVAWNSLLTTVNDYLAGHAELVVGVWSGLLSLRLLWMMTGLHYIRRLRRRGITAAPAYWELRIVGLCEKLGISRKVRVVESAVARVPVVVGHLKPVIYIPLGLLTQLPAGEIEAVLLHELAHIRRSDFLVNLLQHLAECVFFFNPGLLWTSSLLRNEREHCCDDRAIAETNDRVQYIQALVSFKEYALSCKEHALQGPVFTPAFPGKGNYLLTRAQRLLYNRNSSLRNTDKVFILVSCCCLTILVMALMGTDNSSMAYATRHDSDNRELLSNFHLDTGEGSANTIRTNPMPAGNKSNAAIQSNAGIKLDAITQSNAAAQSNAGIESNEAIMSDEAIMSHAEAHSNAGNQSNTMVAISGTGKEMQIRMSVNGRMSTLVNIQERPEASIAPRDGGNALYYRSNASYKQRGSVLYDRSNTPYKRDNALYVQDNAQRMEDRAQGARSIGQPAVDVESAVDRDQTARDKAQVQRDREQADKDRQQAERDRQQSVKDQEQAEKDRQQAILDREQAARDREQAEKDRKQAERDRAKADRDRIQADKDRSQADAARVKADKEKEQADKNRATKN